METLRNKKKITYAQVQRCDKAHLMFFILLFLSVFVNKYEI